MPLAVENAMKEHPGIQGSVVAVRGVQGQEELVGYYVATQQAANHPMDTPSLRAFLQVYHLEHRVTGKKGRVITGNYL